MNTPTKMIIVRHIGLKGAILASFNKYSYRLHI